MSRNGHHVTVGTVLKLADNFAPSGRPVPLKKETLKPVPGLLAQIAHMTITVGTAFGIMYGTLFGVSYFTPIYAEAPEISLRAAPETFDFADQQTCHGDCEFLIGDVPSYSSALTVSNSKSDGTNLVHNYAFYASEGESAFMDSVTIGDSQGDVVKITGKLIVNGVDITPKDKKGKKE